MASDAVTVIQNDHRVMEALFEELRDPASDRPALLDEVAARFAAHARAEEEQVYPALVEADPSQADDVHHGLDEHHEAEELLEELRATALDSPAFDEVLDEFVAAVSHHVEEEESELLPRLAESVGKARLQELGRAFEQARLHQLRGAGFEQAGEAADTGNSDAAGHRYINKDDLVDAARRRG